MAASCFKRSVLDIDAAHHRQAANDEALIGVGLTGVGLVREAAQEGGDTWLDSEGPGHPDFDSAHQGKDVDHGLVTGDFGLPEVDLAALAEASASDTGASRDSPTYCKNPEDTRPSMGKALKALV